MSEPLVLPEDLRLPDLSQVRRFSVADMFEWRRLAVEAFWWGPDGRNGMRRVENPDARGHFHWSLDRADLRQITSPDPWTPALVDYVRVAWMRPGVPWKIESAMGQPASIYLDGDFAHSNPSVMWAANGMPHRAEGPAHMGPTDGPYGGFRRWEQHFMLPPSDLLDVLDTAWMDVDLSDDAARALLNEAQELDALYPSAGGICAPWAAAMLSAHCTPHLADTTLNWCRLLAD